MSIEIVNGKIVDTSKDPIGTQIQRIGEQFRNEGYMNGTSNGDFFQAKLLLGSLNITPSRETKKFTLVSSDNSAANEDDLVPKPVSGEDKFPHYDKDSIVSAIDEFYEQDEDLAESEKAARIPIINWDHRLSHVQITFKLAHRLSIEKLPTPANKSINKYFRNLGNKGLQS